MASQPLRVGVIGLGAIGREVIHLAASYADEITISAGFSRSVPVELQNGAITIAPSLDDLLAHDLDVVVEVAGHQALRDYAPRILRAGRDMLVISVGALADPDVEREIRIAARESGSRVRIPSGAVGALDALAAASIGGLTRAVHTTRKPARTLLGPEADGMTDERELFHGPAREAVKLFPESVNVMAAVSLAGIGFDRTESRVIADPGVERNVHQVEAEGAFGSLRFEIRNVPSESNPKTGRIVAMSIISTLRQSRLAISIG